MIRQVALAFMACPLMCLNSMGVSLYPTLNEYYVECDEIEIYPNKDRLITINMTNPDEIESAFQFDMFLPPGLEPIHFESTMDFAQSVSGGDVNATYESSTRCLRILVTGNTNWNAGNKQPVARIRLKATNQFTENGMISFTHFIFTLKNDNHGYYGAPISVNAYALVYGTSISLNLNSADLYINDFIQLFATITPANASQSVTWVSNSPYIATVDTTGKVVAKQIGTATITATTTDGSNLSAYCNVNVGDYVSSITIYKSKSSTYVGESIVLSAVVDPPTALNQNVSWHSNNPEIATVSQNGRVYGIGVGTATITATATDGSGVSASCAIPVEKHVESITLDITNIELFPNDVVQLNATILPEFGTNKNLKWSSSNSSIATVSNGLVRGIKPGHAIITAKATDGSNVTATCEVTVIPEYALTAPNLQHVRGNTECNVSYPIELINNKSAISALQFDMTLPTGLSMAMKSGYPDVWLDDARKTRTHSVEANPIGTNKYRFIVSSTMNKDLVGNSGDLVHMNLRFDTIHSAGTYYINLNNIVLTESNETQHTAGNTSSAVSLNYLLGDANADFSIDAADYVATAAKILSKPVPIFYSDAANVNNDNTINVTDLVGITNIALGIRPIEIRPAPNIGNNSMNSIPSIRCTTSEGDAQLAIAVENSQAFAGLQMDFSLPNGFTVCDAELVGRAAKQQLGISHLPNGKVRLLVSSFSGEDISSGNDDILLITLQGVADQAEAVVDSIYAVERDLNTYELDSQTVLLGTTGISAVMTYDHVRISSDGQKIVIESPANGTAQIILLNGITRDITVKAGKNSYPMEPGYYIVRMNGQTAKIRL